MSDYWTGLVEGFQGTRERNYEKRFKEEQANRASADRIFSYLLASRDPEIQKLAISGLMNPIHRKKGFAGFMGEVEKDPYAAQIVEAMNQMVPDHSAVSSAPTPPVGGAGMSTNQPVHLGTEAINPAPGGVSGTPGIQLPPEPPPGVRGGGVDIPGAMGGGFAAHGQAGPGTGSAGEIPMPPAGAATAGPQMGPNPQLGPEGIPMPPAPQAAVESKWKRRGTGVPTAEEIAEETERRKVMGKVALANEMLAGRQYGMTPDDVHRVAMDALGVPSNPRNFQQSTLGAIIPGSTVPEPIGYDTSTGTYHRADGSPLPLGSKIVNMRAGAGGGGATTTKIKDDAQGRAYLLQNGVTEEELAGGSPTGYWKVVSRPDGTINVQADMYTPPPAFSGTTTILDTSGNATTAGITRGGGVVPLGSAPSQQPSAEQGQATALLDVVKQRVRAAEAPYGTRTKSLKPAEVDAIVRQAASEANPPLPYTSLVQLEQATKVPTTKQITPRANAPKGTKTAAPGQSMAEKVRQDLMRSRGMQGPAIPAPPAPPSAVAPSPAGRR